MKRITRKKTTLQEHNLYGNITVLSPDGIPMFHSNQRKLNFYIKNGLIDQLDNVTYRLNFQPKGLGHNGNINELPIRKNQCVITGSEINLTRHHIVPRFFRKLNPERYASNFKLIVLVNRHSHDDYTIEEMKYLDVLAQEFGSRTYSEIDVEFRNRLKLKKIAKRLYYYGNKIEDKSIKGSKELFFNLSGLQPNIDTLEMIIDEEIITAPTLFAKELMATGLSYEKLEELWFNHFVETMQPRFLP